MEKIMPLLKENWINPGPDGRLRWQDRDTWQSVFLERETMMSMLEIINGLENVSDMTVVDAGCEAGLFSVILSQKFKKVIAIDSDETSIINAKKTLKIFDSFGFDISNIEVIHDNFNEQRTLLEYDAILMVDGFGTGNKDILSKVKMFIRTDREDFQISLEEQEEYIKELRKKYKEFNFNLTEYKTMKHCRRADAFVGRKNETNI
jgi:precorrin-6B methylase 2